MTRRNLTAIAIAAALTGGGALAAILLAGRSEGSTPAVIARGLDNPRGLAFGADGELYVAEAGSGGRRCLRGGASCYGTSAAIARVDPGTGRVARIAAGLPSFARRDGSFATGVDDVAVGAGRLLAIETRGPAAARKRLPARARRLVGELVAVRGRRIEPAGDVSRYEAAHDPDGAGVESDPYAVLSRRHGALVADAGGNDILAVRHGRVSLAWVLRNVAPRVQAVPTALARGPGGAVYVGELPGGSSTAGRGRVIELVPGRHPTVYASGFDQITGLDFARDGTMYVTELGAGANGRGDVVAVAGDGARTILGGGELRYPAGAIVGPDGDLYVSNWSVEPRRSRGGKGAGEVVRIAR